MPSPRYRKRHLSDDGVWRVCRAEMRACKLTQHRLGKEFSHLRAFTPSGRPVKRSSAGELPFELRGMAIADWSVGMGDEEVRVAPAGVSGKWCEACGAYLTSRALSEVSHSDTLDCPNCEESLQVNELPVDFCEDQLRFVDEQAVREAHWFHISERANWDAGTKAAEVLTHLGSKHAAMERMAQLIAQKETKGRHFYLHEVVLNQQVRVQPDIWNDQVGWPEKVSRPHARSDSDIVVGRNEVLRYLNYYEGPGTVSLMADPNAYTLLVSVPIPST